MLCVVFVAGSFGVVVCLFCAVLSFVRLFFVVLGCVVFVFVSAVLYCCLLFFWGILFVCLCFCDVVLLCVWCVSVFVYF